MFILVFAAISLPLALLFVWIYNSLIFRKNSVEQSWSGIQTFLKQKADLIPELVTVVKKSTDHEKELITKITDAREKMIVAQTEEAQQLKDSDELSKLVKKVLVMIEAYPEINSSQQFLELQKSIQDVEENLSAARRAYNASILHYNNGVEFFPFNIVAKIYSFQRKGTVNVD